MYIRSQTPLASWDGIRSPGAPVGNQGAFNLWYWGPNGRGYNIYLTGNWKIRECEWV